MAGTNSSFNAAKFRTAIRFAMAMGTPPSGDAFLHGADGRTSADQLTFHWNPTTTTAAVKDGEGVPFDPGATITRATPTPVSKPCAVEFLDAANEATPFGVVIPSKVKVILLDEDYAPVKDADYVVIAGDKYVRSHEPPSVGLFDIGVHTIVFAAENEL